MTIEGEGVRKGAKIDAGGGVGLADNGPSIGPLAHSSFPSFAIVKYMQFTYIVQLVFPHRHPSRVCLFAFPFHNK